METFKRIIKLLQPRIWVLGIFGIILLGQIALVGIYFFIGRSSPSPPAIVEAYRRGDLVTMEAILEDDPSQADARLFTEGDTLLHAAVQKGETNVISLLLRHGADSRAPGADGTTPLDIAHARGQEDLIGMLSAP